MKYSLIAILGTWFLAAVFARPAGASESSLPTHRFTVYPIGHIAKEGNRTMIVLEEKYQPGLMGLDGFSHLHVLFWFDRNDVPEKRSVLQVHPRGNPQNPLSGVFATRSPARPNPIGMTSCKIISIRDNIIDIDKIDAFPGTPVLDLKPYLPGNDVHEASTPDWIQALPECNE